MSEDNRGILPWLRSACTLLGLALFVLWMVAVAAICSPFSQEDD